MYLSPSSCRPHGKGCGRDSVDLLNISSVRKVVPEAASYHKDSIDGDQEDKYMGMIKRGGLRLARLSTLMRSASVRVPALGRHEGHEPADGMGESREMDPPLLPLPSSKPSRLYAEQGQWHEGAGLDQGEAPEGLERSKFAASQEGNSVKAGCERFPLLRKQSVEESQAAQENSMKSMQRLLWENVIEVYVEVLGRTYYFRATSSHECDEWIESFNEARRLAEEEYQRNLDLSNAERLRLAVQRSYDSNVTQMGISLVLIANFIISIVQSELTAGMDDDLNKQFDTIDMAFTIAYSVELCVNLYAHWFWSFFCSGWCGCPLLCTKLARP